MNEKLGAIAYGLEQFMMPWNTIPWDEAPAEVQEVKDGNNGGPTGVGKHPKFGWFVLASGQGPFIVFCETDNETLLREFEDYRPIGGRTPQKEPK